MKTIGIIIIALVVFIGVGFLLFQQSKQPQGDLPGQTFEIQGAQHTPGCNIGEPPYNSNPPTSGCHDSKPASWGNYDQTLPDAVIIHNLEHGGIWISYQPDLEAKQVEQLKDMARRYRKIIVEPRGQNDAPIALAAWGRLQKLDQYDESAILKFIEAFHDKGPEKAD